MKSLKLKTLGFLLAGAFVLSGSFAFSNVEKEAQALNAEMSFRHDNWKAIEVTCPSTGKRSILCVLGSGSCNPGDPCNGGEQ